MTLKEYQNQNIQMTSEEFARFVNGVSYSKTHKEVRLQWWQKLYLKYLRWRAFRTLNMSTNCLRPKMSNREHNTPEKECLQMIADVAVGYDGFCTVESLKGLIDEMANYARMGLKGEWPYAKQ